MMYYCGSCDGGTPVLVLCIGIEFRLHMTNSVVVVVLDIPMYWYYVLVLVFVVIVVVVPVYWLWWLKWWYQSIGIMY